MVHRGKKYKVGKITTSGSFSEYAFAAGTYPGSITVGPKGNLWVAMESKIGKITPSGTHSEYSHLSGSDAGYLTTGPEGTFGLATSGPVRWELCPPLVA